MKVPGLVAHNHSREYYIQSSEIVTKPHPGGATSRPRFALLIFLTEKVMISTKPTLTSVQMAMKKLKFTKIYQLGIDE